MIDRADAPRILLERAGLTMEYERTSSRNAPYPNGAGFRKTYSVSFSGHDTTAEVIALISNEHVPPQPFQILTALSFELDELEGAESFEQWQSIVAAHDPMLTYEARLIADGEGHSYLQARYTYLKMLKDTLTSIFPSDDYSVLRNFWFSYIANDWPPQWSQEGNDHATL